MAIHSSIDSLLGESLPELLYIAQVCISSHKDPKLWPAGGCYGYPAALLLLSIADSIGSYVIQKSTKENLRILNNPNYYCLSIEDRHLDILYDHYRNPLIHNSAMLINTRLRIGNKDDQVLIIKNNVPVLSLIPFYNSSVIAVENFLTNLPEISKNNRQINNMMKKSITRKFGLEKLPC
ncbi:MAG: hypothetical protein U0525_00645 [Patescibacteria group bacterium]